MVVAERHDVAKNRIYAWRSDARFKPDGSERNAFTSVAVDVDQVQMASNQDPLFLQDMKPEPRIEINLENGRRLSVSEGVCAGAGAWSGGMIPLLADTKISLAAGETNMRRGFNGLTAQTY